MNISKLKGIGEQTAQKFAKLGITTTDDLLLFYPKAYERFEEPVTVSGISCEGDYSIRGVILENPKVNFRNPSQPLTVLIADSEGGRIKGRWFHSNFMAGSLRKGYRYIFRGRVHFQGSNVILDQARLYSEEEYANLLRSTPLKPIYRLTHGLSQNAISKAMLQCFEKDLIPEDYLPQDMLAELKLPDLYHALYSVHNPKTEGEAVLARKRLAFDEFFLFTLGVRRNKLAGQVPNSYVADYSDYSNQVLQNLPYELTDAQKTVREEIHCDFTGKGVANRLIQGDVGSGKTILAFLSMLDIAAIGAQSVLMAPTEVLAEQHYEALCQLIRTNHLPLTCELLTGSVKESEKKNIRERILNGQADFIIGTHAVFTEKVEYHNLGLVITDEQHRFGVRQREAIFAKGKNPHTLVMSATPIPRSLAVILYGDLDISVLNEKPANRLPIRNCVVDSSFHPNAYRFITKQVQAGHQAYVICAMAEENEESELENVVDYSEKLKEELGNNIRVAYLHGKMKPAEKSTIMENFAAHRIDVLVSTTVIEVGIDVANATVIMIENAERFGLSALHQLRGRVGRGKDQSYCIFVSDSHSKITQERLSILNKSNDGFHIAEEDLRLRGPGDILGVRQSGDLGFSVGDIYADADELRLAANVADKLLTADPELAKQAHAGIRDRLEEYSQNHLMRLSI